MDGAGNVYVAGETYSPGLPTTNAFQANYVGGYPGVGADAFVAKFNSTCSNLIYMTYLGGSGYDAALGIAVDAAGNAYLTGLTDSPDFPLTPNAIQRGIAGTPSPIYGLHPFDAFVTKLNTNGSALVYSTYLGGNSDDEGVAIAVDPPNSSYSTNCAYIAGFTDSSDFKTFKPLQTNLAGAWNVFVTKLSPAGTNFVYSTYLGGTNDDEGEGIAVDALGRAFVTGLASSGNFPTTNALQPTLGGGQDAFVTVIAPDGQSLVTSTFLGGAANDAGYRIALDAAGHRLRRRHRIFQLVSRCLLPDYTGQS